MQGDFWMFIFTIIKGVYGVINNYKLNSPL